MGDVDAPAFSIQSRTPGNLGGAAFLDGAIVGSGSFQDLAEAHPEVGIVAYTAVAGEFVRHVRDALDR